MNKDKYINIKWQDGVIPENGVNGAQIDDVLLFVAKRLDKLNAKHPDKYNVNTKEYIYLAIREQRRRRVDRENRGVEGKYKN